MNSETHLLTMIRDLEERIKHLERHLASSDQTIGCDTCRKVYLYGPQ